MAGYSRTPLAAKLGIKDGATVAVLHPPPNLVDQLPPGVTVKRQARGRADVVAAFFTRRARLEERVAVLSTMIFPAGGLWIGWPKRASGVPTDITDDAVRGVALPLGLVDNKVCAIDDIWTGLRFVWRRHLRDRPPPGLPAPRNETEQVARAFSS
jgi:hypothetical protein